MPKKSVSLPENTSKIINKSKSDTNSGLDRRFNEVEMRNNKLRTDEIINQNALEDIRKSYIINVFDTMQKMGVDPNDPESIRKFLMLFEQKDPDMFALFESAMNGLLGPEDGIEGPEAQAQPGLMDKFQNIGQEMMMPR